MMTVFEFYGILLKPCLLQPCFHVAGVSPSKAELGFVKHRTLEGFTMYLSLSLYIYIYILSSIQPPPR